MGLIDKVKAVGRKGSSETKVQAESSALVQTVAPVVETPKERMYSQTEVNELVLAARSEEWMLMAEGLRRDDEEALTLVKKNLTSRGLIPVLHAQNPDGLPHQFWIELSRFFPSKDKMLAMRQNDTDRFDMIQAILRDLLENTFIGPELQLTIDRLKGPVTADDVREFIHRGKGNWVENLNLLPILAWEMLAKFNEVRARREVRQSNQLNNGQPKYSTNPDSNAQKQEPAPTSAEQPSSDVNKDVLGGLTTVDSELLADNETPSEEASEGEVPEWMRELDVANNDIPAPTIGNQLPETGDNPTLALIQQYASRKEQ